MRWRKPSYAHQYVRTYTYRVGLAASPYMHRRQYRICDADIIKQRLATRRIMGQSCEFPPGECSYGTGKVKLRPRQIFRVFPGVGEQPQGRSEEHTSELQSLMRNLVCGFLLTKTKELTYHNR